MSLFQKDIFFEQYESHQINRDLLQAMVLISAIVLRQNGSIEQSTCQSHMESLLKVNALSNQNKTGDALLDAFRQECMLAFYHFHQSPGPDGWTRVGTLTRKAYEHELHQIDNDNYLANLDFVGMTNAEREAWRQVWWFIYCIDSYCNITAASPCMVEVDSVHTALAMGVVDGITSTMTCSSPRIFLASDTSSLWTTAKDIVDQDLNFVLFFDG